MPESQSEGFNAVYPIRTLVRYWTGPRPASTDATSSGGRVARTVSPARIIEVQCVVNVSGHPHPVPLSLIEPLLNRHPAGMWL